MNKEKIRELFKESNKNLGNKLSDEEIEELIEDNFEFDDDLNTLFGLGDSEDVRSK